MRVALLDGGDELVAGLRDRGHDAVAVRGETVGVLERLLAARGFVPGLSALPGQWRALRCGGFAVAHAFSPAAAAVARRAGLPVVFTCLQPPERGTVADRRLRLGLLAAAVGGSAAVTAPGEDVREALARWLAVDAEVVAPGDAAAHAALYDRVRERRG